MSPQGPSPFVYVLPALVLGAVLLYFFYGVVDRSGLTTLQAEALVTGKQHTPGSTTHRNTTVDGRSITQAYQNPDVYMVTFDIDDVPSGGVVEQSLYESLQSGDFVRVKYHRTRLTNRLIVTEVAR